MNKARIRLVSALVAVVALSVATLAPAATTKFEGRVKHAGPVSFRVGHGSVKRFQASMNVSCVSAAPPRSDVEVYVVAPGKSANLRKRGQFTMKFNKPKQSITHHPDVLEPVRPPNQRVGTDLGVRTNHVVPIELG